MRAICIMVLLFMKSDGQLTCKDYERKAIEHGEEFMPDPNDRCKTCTCNQGFPTMCRLVGPCSPPACPNWYQDKTDCCEFTCLETPPTDLPADNRIDNTGLSNGVEIFVLQNTTVEIECPLSTTDNMSWFYEKTFLAIGNKINPSEFGQRFSISRNYIGKNYNLQIINFTDADQERYRCQGDYGGKYKQHKVTVKICELPDGISAFKTALHLHPAQKEIYKMNYVCYEDVNLYKLQTTSSEKVPTITMLKAAASNQTSVILNNRKGNQIVLQTYASLQTNYESCLTSNCSFPLNVEWRSSHENTGAVENSRHNVRLDLEIYVCYFNKSNVVDDTQYPNKIKVYRANTTLYFQNLNIDYAGYYHCLFNKIDVLETATLSDDKPNDINFMQLTYTFGGIAAVLVVILLFAGAVIITMVSRNKRQLGTVSVPSIFEQ